MLSKAIDVDEAQISKARMYFQRIYHWYTHKVGPKLHVSHTSPVLTNTPYAVAIIGPFALKVDIPPSNINIILQRSNLRQAGTSSYAHAASSHRHSQHVHRRDVHHRSRPICSHIMDARPTQDAPMQHLSPEINSRMRCCKYRHRRYRFLSGNTAERR